MIIHNNQNNINIINYIIENYPFEYHFTYQYEFERTLTYSFQYHIGDQVVENIIEKSETYTVEIKETKFYYFNKK